MIDVILISASGDIGARWRKLRREHPNLRPIETFCDTNPFTRETTTYSTPDSADVIVNGKSVGQFFWDGARLLCPLEYDEHRDQLESVARTIALALGTTVSVVDDDELEPRFRPPVLS